MKIIRVKVFAILLGPEGTGILSQLSSFQSLIQRSAELGVGGAVTKYTAEFFGKKDLNSITRLYRTATLLFISTGAIIILFVFVFAEPISSYLLGSITYKWFIVISGVTVALQVQTQIAVRTLQGLLKIKETVKLSLSTSLFSVAVSIPLVYLFDLNGAVFSLALVALIGYSLAKYYLLKNVKSISAIELGWGRGDTTYLKNIVKFGGANMFVILSSATVLLIIRSDIINRFGAESNGYFQVAVGVSTQYLSIISTSIWQYGMPKISMMLGKKKVIQQLQNDALRLTLLILTPIIMLLLTASSFWIPLLYSPAFMAAQSLLMWQFLGELVRAIKWAPNMVNQPYERYKFIIGQSIGLSILHVLYYYLLVNRFHIVSAPMAYALAQLTILPIVLRVHFKYDQFLIIKKNVILSLSSIFILGLLAYLKALYIMNEIVLIIIGLLSVLVWAFLQITAEEKNKLIQIINKKIGTL